MGLLGLLGLRVFGLGLGLLGLGLWARWAFRTFSALRAFWALRDFRD